MVFQFRAVSPNTTSGAQAALMTTWQSCDCYLRPVNGPFLCLTFFSYAFAPLFCSLFLFSRLLFYPCFFFFFFFFCLISYCLFFCSFLFIGKASLEPADYPRVFLYKKSDLLNHYGKAGLICGAADRTRTGTVFTPRDFHATLCCHSRQVRRCSLDFIFAMTKRF